MRRALLIVNPYSTQVTGRRITDVERALRERVAVETQFTRHPGHATELAAAAAPRGVDAIVVFSGDGTYNEALNGADGALPFGFLPGGGTSVLPRALGLPRDPAAAAAVVGEALAEGRRRRISLGVVNGRRFSFSAGLGFDGEAVRRLNELGRDPGGARPGDAAFVLVANGDPYSYAGSMPLRVTPGARFEDGLAFAAPERVRLGDVPRLVAALVRGRGYGRHVLAALDVDRIEVRCDRPLPLQSDGEDLGDVEHAVFEAQRDAVDVLV